MSLHDRLIVSQLFGHIACRRTDTSIQVLALNKAHAALYQIKHGMEWIVDDFFKRIDGCEM
jgi:hypothetical protein